jgi:hypothetical protein
MLPRPAHEPSTANARAQRLLDDAAKFTPALGCQVCPDFGACGGLHVETGLFDCNDLCTCKDKAACDMVCRNKPEAFFDRFQEVGGFDLSSVPRVAARPIPALPTVVPLIGHKYSRKTVLAEKVVALPLYELFHMGTGEPHVRTRAELAQRFFIPEDAVIVVTGVDRDIKLEAWWAFADRERLMATLRDLGVALVTGPNFSLFTDTPRPDNLHSIKRIALSWAELMDGGIPAALHLNARTDYDYRRWSQFVRARSEVTVVAFEFGTGAGYQSRIDWHVDRLCALADRAGRPLTLVLRGGIPALARLRAHFDQVILIETDAFARTLKRRRAEINAAGRLRWVKVTTAKGAPLDELMAHNVASHRAYLQSAAPRRPLRLVRGTAKRAAEHTDGEARQGSLVPNLELTLKAGAVAANLQDVVVATKA